MDLNVIINRTELYFLSIWSIQLTFMWMCLPFPMRNGPGSVCGTLEYVEGPSRLISGGELEED